jgi:hypothetical protein
MRRFMIAHALWLGACCLLILQRLLVILCLPLLAASTWFFMAQSERTFGYSIQGASYFWRPLPARPRTPFRKRRIKATVLPPLDSSPKRRIP